MCISESNQIVSLMYVGLVLMGLQVVPVLGDPTCTVVPSTSDSPGLMDQPK